jgi:peptidoglycan/xylan/chitin deacetylase (PgdA/CDA1 family)
MRPNARLLILCYHAVSESWPSPVAVAPRVLDRQLRHLLRRGYRPRTLSAALRNRGSDRQGDEKTLVVTFDDAFRSVLDSGFEVLERLQVPATLFVPTDVASEAGLMTWSSLGGWVGTPHEPELRCMSWAGIRQLSEAGWEIGSHTCSHPKLTEIETSQAEGELSRSRTACESALQRPCPSLAYPFGASDARVVELARGSGYEQGVALGTRLLDSLPSRSVFELPRDGVYRSTSWPYFLALSSPTIRRVRTSRIYHRLL